jgi:serine beta-lactamase-like protein LACTB, mitochondrial
MSNTRVPRGIAFFLLGVGVLIVAVPSVLVYVRLTATRVNPDPERIASVTNSPPSQKWAAAVERGRDFVRTTLSEENLPGISVAVGVDGEIVWAEGFGFANLENSVPVTPDHRFRIGTASIPLTSAGIGLLLDERRLKLDDEVQTYVPEFGGKQFPPTIRQVMGHLGGLMGEDPDLGVLTSSHCEQTADALALFVKKPISKPGAEYQYSTFGWVLLSAVVETAANNPLAAFLEERVFRPLGMLDTVRDSVTEPVPNEATSYFPKFLSRPAFGVEPLPKFDSSCYAGSSGYLSTASDLVLFAMGINGAKLLRRETVQLLQTPQRAASGEETGYGLGWELKTMLVDGQPVRTAGHEGTVWGRTSVSLLTLPERGIAVAVLSNISSLGGTFSVEEKIAQAFAASQGR